MYLATIPTYETNDDKEEKKKKKVEDDDDDEEIDGFDAIQKVFK